MDMRTKQGGPRIPKYAAYGIASLGDSLSYNLFYSYFIYFITTYAGVRPGTAGIISFLAVIWDGVTDPVIGFISDHSASKRGRRTPFLIWFSVPLGITVAALFQNPNFSTNGKIAYYLIVNILFWLFFTLTDIPYLAFGGELATDYDERTRIRKFARLFMSCADIIAIAGTLPLVDFLAGKIGDETQAWGALGILFGTLSAMTFFITGIALRKQDRPLEKTEERVSFLRVLKDYLEVMKLKEFQKIICIAGIANLIIGIGSSCNLFVWKYSYLFSSLQISIVGLVGTVCSLFAAFPADILSRKYGKKAASAAAFIMIITGFFILYFCPNTLPFAMMAQIIKLSGVSMFWTIIFSMVYDITEVDEFRNGTRREGILTSLNSFFMKVGVSLGMWFAGVMMDVIGLDPEAASQTAEVVGRLNFCAKMIPAIIALAAMAISFQYKISHDKFVLLQTELEKKRGGKEYSANGFEDIL